MCASESARACLRVCERVFVLNVSLYGSRIHVIFQCD